MLGISVFLGSLLLSATSLADPPVETVVMDTSEAPIIRFEDSEAAIIRFEDEDAVDRGPELTLHSTVIGNTGPEQDWQPRILHLLRDLIECCPQAEAILAEHLMSWEP
jgi:hypothetical protein